MMKSRRIRGAQHVTHICEKRNAYKILVGNPEGKGPQGRPKHRWEDYIQMDVREIGWCGVHWIHVAQDRDQW
jgi:hypothetical protein